MNNEAEFEEEVYKWWSSLHRDPGARARMRHQADILGIMMNEEFYNLVIKVPYVRRENLACIAMALSHVDYDSKNSVPCMMGRKSGQSEHTVSEQRFRRIIESDSEEAVRQLIRVLPMIGSEGDVRDIARTFRFWNSDSKISQKRWIEEYYLSNNKTKEE